MKVWFKNERGQALVMVVIVFMVIIGVCGLVVDAGSLYFGKSSAQKAVDAAALAGAQSLLTNPAKAQETAVQYGVKNGLGADMLDVDVNGSTVTVSAEKSVQLFFMPLIGMGREEVIAASATAEVKQGSQIYNYVLFSADSNRDLTLNGHNTAMGNVHINGGAVINGSNSIQGNLEVVKSFRKNGNSHIDRLIHPADHIPMPEFNLEYYREHATKVYHRNISNTNITLDGITFVDGDVTLSGQTSGVGTIVATGTITISGGLEYQNGDDFIGLYAKEGIVMKGNGTVDGFLYAPEGTITMKGNHTIHGALIAQSFTVAGNQTFRYDSRVANVGLSNAKLTE